MIRALVRFKDGRHVSHKFDLWSEVSEYVWSNETEIYSMQIIFGEEK